jgi:hypothetical protein
MVSVGSTGCAAEDSLSVVGYQEPIWCGLGEALKPFFTVCYSDRHLVEGGVTMSDEVIVDRHQSR